MSTFTRLVAARAAAILAIASALAIVWIGWWALALVVAFLVWDFFLMPVGPLEAHLLLAIGWTWLGVALWRMPVSVWRGEHAR